MTTAANTAADEAPVNDARPEQRQQEGDPSVRTRSAGECDPEHQQPLPSPPSPPATATAAAAAAVSADVPSEPRLQTGDMKSPGAEEDTGEADDASAQKVQTERRQKKDYFPFMELPSELRLEIYRMALSRPKPILLHMPRPSEKEQNQSEYQWEAEESESGLAEDRANRNETNDGEGPLAHARRSAPDRRTESRRQLPTGDSGINTDPLVPALLRASQLIYREARPVLYSDNELVLHLPSALCTLSQLHQRSRSLIKHVRLAIPTHHDILEGFADLVRLGLRYCWGLKTFTISLPDMFPEERHVPSSTTNVYANAFHILRWLPKNTLVQLEGNVHDEIRKVVEENGQLSKKLNEKEYLRRQHQMPDRR